MKAAVLFKPNEPLQVVDCELDPPKANDEPLASAVHFHLH